MNTSTALMRGRMKPLSRCHRIAHLRALLRRPWVCPIRREQLAALLRDEMSAQSSCGDFRA